ncbi:MAG: glycine/sarcosine/betaine reductase selenoprotein B family protein [Pseudomonadales bacterium]
MDGLIRNVSIGEGETSAARVLLQWTRGVVCGCNEEPSSSSTFLSSWNLGFSMRHEDVPERLAQLPCPEMGEPAAASGPAIDQRRVALISTAGLMHAGDRPFGLGSADYRIIDSTDPRPLFMSHISTNFDRSGFAQDLNVVMPLDVLRGLAERREIGSLAQYHYSFMGATDPAQMLPAVEQLAGLLAGDAVDLALLVPV